MDKNENILPDNIDERIEAFLRGQMTAEEETAFKQEIKANPDLRNRAMTMTSLIKGMREQEFQRETKVIASVNHSRKTTVSRIFWWTSSIAAAFIIGFFVYKDYRYKTLDSMISPYYTHYDLTDMTRGDVDSVTVARLYELFNQVQEKRDMSNVIEGLEPIYHSLETDYTYYPWANDIAWNLALAYIKDDQIDKAELILKQLVKDNPDMSIGEKAKELLQEIQTDR